MYWTFFHMKNKSYFKNIQRFSSYTQKCVKKWQISGFTINAMTSKPNNIFDSKLDTIILKPTTKLCLNFKVVSLELTEKKHVKERHGRIGASQAGSSRIWVLNVKTNFFCSMDYVPKINTKRDMRYCDLSYVTAEG